MDYSSECTPGVSVIHDEKMVASCDEAVSNVGRWTVTVDGGLLIDELFDEATIS
jgi:hypothetical protein